MRSLVVALLCTILSTPAWAQEQKPDIWNWAPHLTLYYGKATGHIESPHWYRVQDRRSDVNNARAFSADLSAGRWSLNASTLWVHNRPDLRGSAFGLNVTVATLGRVRPGFGARYAASENATVLFSSGGTSIASASQRQLITAIADVGVGRYDRSHIRAQVLYGNARLTESLDLFVQRRVAESPLALYHFSHSDFLGVGATAAIRLYGFSLEGTVARYSPLSVSDALPANELVITGGGSLVLPVWLKLGSGAGMFVRGTRVVHHRPPDHQSLQFLDGGLSFGFTARIP